MSDLTGLINALQEAAQQGRVPQTLIDRAVSAMNAPDNANNAALASLGAAITAAQAAVASAAVTDGGEAQQAVAEIASSLASAATTALENSLRSLGKFTKKELEYLDLFKNGTAYDIEVRDGKGGLVHKVVKGEEMRAAITTIKVNTLSEEERQQLPEAAKPSSGNTLKQLDDVDNSLDMVAGRKAWELHKCGRDKDIGAMYEGVERAHRDVERKRREVKASEADDNIPATEAVAKARRDVHHHRIREMDERLRRSAQGVLDDALELKTKDTPPEKDQSQRRFESRDVDTVPPPLLPPAAMTNARNSPSASSALPGF